MRLLSTAVLGVVLCAALGVACSTSSRPAGVTVVPITGSPTSIPTATLPAVLPTPKIVGTVIVSTAYNQALTTVPCEKGKKRQDVDVWIDPDFDILCDWESGDVTILVKPTGDPTRFCAVKVKVDAKIRELIPNARRRWLLWVSQDIKDFKFKANPEDGGVVCPLVKWEGRWTKRASGRLCTNATSPGPF